jgi:hypothetical protein
MVVEPITNAANKGIIIAYVVNWDCGLGEFLVGMNLSRSLGLLTMNTKVVGTP